MSCLSPISKTNPFDDATQDLNNGPHTATTHLADTATPLSKSKSTTNSKSKTPIKSLLFPPSDQTWLVALATKVKNLGEEGGDLEIRDEGEGGNFFGDGAGGGLEDDEEDIYDEVGVLMADAKTRSMFGAGRRGHFELEGVEEEEGVEGRHTDGVSVSMITAVSNKLGKMRAVESDDEDTAMDTSGKRHRNADLTSEIENLRQQLKLSKSENAKLNQVNKDLNDDLAELSKSVKGDGTLSQSDREIRERMFDDMHKLVQKVGVLEKKNGVLEAENAKLRTLLNAKSVTVEIQPQGPSTGWDPGLLVPHQDTIESPEAVKMVEDLNTKIIQLAKEVQKQVTRTLDVQVFQPRMVEDICDDASSVVGKKFAKFLKQHTKHHDVPRIVIRVGLQAVLARICEIGITDWCPHNKTSSKEFTAVYENIVKTVNLTVADNWRRLTHSHIQLDKVAWKKRAISNLKSIIDLVYYPYLTPTESSFTEYASPFLDPLYYAVCSLRSALTTGLVTTVLYISFPIAGQAFEASWMQPFTVNHESLSDNATDGNSKEWVMTSITLGVDRLTRAGGWKSVLNPKVVLEQPPLLTPQVRRDTVGVGPRFGLGSGGRVVSRNLEGRLSESQQRRSQAPQSIDWSRWEVNSGNQSPPLPPRRFPMAGGIQPGRRPIP